MSVTDDDTILRARLEDLVKEADAADAKVAAARRRMQAAQKLLEEEQIRVADLEKVALVARKKTSSSTDSTPHIDTSSDRKSVV